MTQQNDSKMTFEYIYEGIMVILAFTAVATIWYQTRYDSFIVWGTWSVFFTDFIIRFTKAERKMAFIKSNPFIVIAVIPLDAVFQMARLARILHFMRLKVITKYYTKPVIEKIRQQRFAYVIPGIFAVLFIAIIPLYMLEPRLETYFDAFRGGLASLVFFGYSTINPQTTPGTVIITLLTVFGVILHGVFLSYLFSVISSLSFVEKWSRRVKQKRKKAS